MKDIIALFICLPLIASFIPIYTVQVVNNRNMDRVDGIVNAAKEEARGEGYFTEEIKSTMIQNIIDLGFSEEKIIVNVTETPKYRKDTFDARELIHYKIGVKIDKIVGGNSVFGISDEDNKTIHYISGEVTSERLPET